MSNIERGNDELAFWMKSGEYPENYTIAYWFAQGICPVCKIDTYSTTYSTQLMEIKDHFMEKHYHPSRMDPTRDLVYGIIQQIWKYISAFGACGLQGRHGDIKHRDEEKQADALFVLNREFDIPMWMLARIFNITNHKCGDLLYVGLMNRGKCSPWMANVI